jgi:hypothetical protein
MGSPFNFCGPAYESQSPNADAQRLVNFYLEAIESGAGKSRFILAYTPGLSVFATLPETNVRAQETINGRHFAIGGSRFCEISAAGAVTNYGAVENDGLLAYIKAGQGYLAIASGGKAYSFNLTTNVLAEIDTTTGAALQGAVSQVGYSDGYFIFLLKNTNKFQISGLIAVTFDPLDIAQLSVYADNVVSMIIDHREVWFLGQKATQPYFDSGNPLFPFEVISGAYIEQGSFAQNSVTKMDNSLFWVGGDERGFGIGWRAQGYLPVRITNHAIEKTWQGYGDISDAIGYAFQFNGHNFWRVYFPAAGKTWQYDAATNTWAELQHFADGVATAHRSQNHVLVGTKHLLGDWSSANIYETSDAFLDDAGVNIRRVRRAPYIADGSRRFLFFNELEFDMDMGIGPLPALQDGAGNPRPPMIMVTWSDDGVKTWSNELEISVGQAGEYSLPAKASMLGCCYGMKGRVFEVVVTDPVPWRFTDARVSVS